MAESRADVYKRSREKRYPVKRAFLDGIKLGRGCADCGYRAHSAALDFDHVRGMKLFTVAHCVMSRADRLLAEIAKCDVVCANCHRIRTANRRKPRD